MQAEPNKPRLEAPETRLSACTGKSEKLLSSAAFNFNLRRFIACLRQLNAEGVFRTASDSDEMLDSMPRLKLKRQRQQDRSAADLLAGAFSCPLFSST